MWYGNSLYLLIFSYICSFYPLPMFARSDLLLLKFHCFKAEEQIAMSLLFAHGLKNSNFASVFLWYIVERS